MGRLIACEWYRMRRSAVLLAATISLCVLGVVLADPGILSEQPTVPGMPSDVQGIFMAEAADTGFAFLLFGNVVVALLLGTQFSERTIGHEIMSGHSRPKVFGSRCFTCLLVPAALTLIALGSGVVRNAFAFPASADSWVYFTRVIILLVPMYAALAAPVALIVALCRDTARSAAATVVYMFMALWSFSILMHSAPVVQGTAYTVNPSALLMIHPVFLARWVLSPDLGASQMAFAVVVSIGWTAAFLGVSWAVLRKYEMR